MFWVDPTDPEVLAAVAGEGTTEADPLISTALWAAGEILTLATGFRVHPAGTATEEFIGPSRVRSFTLMTGPVVELVELVTVDPVSGEQSPVARPHRLVGNTVVLFSQPGGSSSTFVATRRLSGGACAPNQVIYRLTYRYASTVSLGARAALLTYARQLWLALSEDGECQLPERTTSVVREGIGIELMTPQDFLDKGRVGLPSVDTWLAQANPKRSLRPSAVYTPDSPPGVGVVRGRL
jgi:hypothetical protein